MPNNKRASQIKDFEFKNKNVTNISNPQVYINSNEVIKDLIDKAVEEYNAF